MISISTLALGQAAAEYVGVLLRNGMSAISSIGNEILSFARANPAAIVVGALVLIALWRLLSRR